MGLSLLQVLEESGLLNDLDSIYFDEVFGMGDRQDRYKATDKGKAAQSRAQAKYNQRIYHVSLPDDLITWLDTQRLEGESNSALVRRLLSELKDRLN